MNNSQPRWYIPHLVTAAIVAGGLFGYHKLTAPQVAPTPPAPLPAPAPAPPKPQPPSLLTRMQAAYDLDKINATFKAGQKLQLIGLFQATADNCKMPDVVTVGQLLADMRVAASKYLAAGTLIDVRRLVADEAVKLFGTEAARPLDAELRTKGAAFFTEMADTLKAVQ